MPSGSAFSITYPSTISVTGITTCDVIYGGVTYSMTGCSVDTTSRSIYVEDGFNTAVTAGS
jgi:hypothetical protein